VNGPVHPAASQQGGVGGVDEGVGLDLRDIALNQLDPVDRASAHGTASISLPRSDRQTALGAGLFRPGRACWRPDGGGNAGIDISGDAGGARRTSLKTIHIIEETMPFAWEKAVMACWEQGESFPTQYDKPSDPNSRDVVAMIHVTRPMSEPRIHRAFRAGWQTWRSTGSGDALRRADTGSTRPWACGSTPTTNGCLSTTSRRPG